MASRTKIANEAWEALFRAQATIARELAAGDVWGELSPREYGVLYALSNAPSGLRITELGNDVLLTQPGLSRLVARLENAGLVERVDDPEDGRACRIRLTGAGAQAQRQVGARHGLHVAERMTRTLSSEQLLQLRDLCSALTAAPHTQRGNPNMSTDSHRDDRHAPSDAEPKRLVVVSAGTGDPSSTRQLTDRIAQKTLARLRAAGTAASSSVIELGPLAVDIARATIAGFPNPQLQAAIDRLAAADAIIAATPVYKAGMSGLFKSFVDVLDNDLLVAKPALLAATGGSARHALVIDNQMRPLFAYLRALTLPTSIYAAPEDWSAAELGDRIERAASELTVLVRAGVEDQIAHDAWSSYQHEFAGNATRAERNASDVDFDSPLMRLAAGGKLDAADREAA